MKPALTPPASPSKKGILDDDAELPEAAPAEDYSPDDAHLATFFEAGQSGDWTTAREAFRAAVKACLREGGGSGKVY